MISENQCIWPNTFLANFIDQFWEKDPTSFPNPVDKSFVSLEELFFAVSTMPSLCESDRLWILRNAPPKTRDDFEMANLALLGPKKTDLNFEGFFKRFERHTFGVNIHNINAAKPELAQRVAPLVQAISSSNAAIRPMNWILDTFFGTYHATPFGIHKDNASVFSYILQGKRTYATWHSSYFKENDPDLRTPDIQSVERHLKNAEIFEVNQGEVFYWPSNRWHIALSDGKPSVVAQISAYFDITQLDHWQS